MFSLYMYIVIISYICGPAFKLISMHSMYKFILINIDY